MRWSAVSIPGGYIRILMIPQAACGEESWCRVQRSTGIHEIMLLLLTYFSLSVVEVKGWTDILDYR